MSSVVNDVSPSLSLVCQGIILTVSVVSGQVKMQLLSCLYRNSATYAKVINEVTIPNPLSQQKPCLHIFKLT